MICRSFEASFQKHKMAWIRMLRLWLPRVLRSAAEVCSSLFMQLLPESRILGINYFLPIDLGSLVKRLSFPPKLGRSCQPEELPIV